MDVRGGRMRFYPRSSPVRHPQRARHSARRRGSIRGCRTRAACPDVLGARASRSPPRTARSRSAAAPPRCPRPARSNTTFAVTPPSARTGTEQMQQHLEPVTAEVHHRSAAGHRPAAAATRADGPAADRNTRTRSSARTTGCADFTGRDDLLDPQSPPDRSDGSRRCPRRDAVGAARRDHAIAFRRGHRHRLLAQHVLAGFGRGDGLLRVDVDRRRDVDASTSGSATSSRQSGVPSARADLARERRRQLGTRPADGHELARRRIAQAPAPRALRTMSPAPIRPQRTACSVMADG